LLENQLQVLEKRQFVVTELPEPEVVYRFKQNLIREVAYQTLPFSLRRQLHRQIAQRIEQVYTSDLSSHYALLAQHWGLAEETEKALRYLLLEGDTARRLYALKEAILHYQAALQLLDKEEDGTKPGRFDLRARTWMKLGLTYQLDSDYRNARQAYETGFELWQKAAKAPTASVPLAARPLRMDWPYMPLGLDPALAADVDTYGLVSLLFSGLVSLGSCLEVLPDVAASWEVSDDGQHYLFHLTDNACWNDGTPLTAADFEFAWKRVLDPGCGSPLADLLYAIKGASAYHSGQTANPQNVGVRAVDERILEVELEQPTSYFLYLIANQAYYPLPRHVVEARGAGWAEPEGLVSNGAFILKAWRQQGEQAGEIQLTRNPSYHGRFLGNLSEVLLRAYPKLEERLKAYETGQLDMLSLRDFMTERERVRQKHPGEYLSAPNLGLQYLGFALKRSPFNDERVRQAFVLAVDRERYADEYLHGFAFPATGGFVPPGMPGHSAGIGLKFQPELARQLLAEAGYPGGKDFPELEFIAGPGLEADLKYLVARWKAELDITVQGRLLGWDEYMDRMQNRLPDIFMSIWVNDYPDPDNFLRENDALRWAGWQEPRYLELVEAARRTLDQQKRLEMYREADTILIQSAALMPFKYLRSHFLVKPWVKRFPVSAIGWWYLSEVILETEQ
jgi:oligopeptide transport system substrate-binding protein